ncbi:MAG: shikimate dehydrogenase [Methanotrichaceae archaeon]|nr:shikimate dehydrogenase [Methanotrichaceae archaeon]
MEIYGILGDPIEHSLSPIMHNAAFRALGIKACYQAYHVTKERLRDAIIGADAMNFKGLNITIPLKEIALSLVQADEFAEAIGAVNTISFGHEIRGYNTDGVGAIMALQEAGTDVSGRCVLLIGAGGASKALGYTLAQRGAQISIVNRNYKRAQELADRIGAKAHGFSDLRLLVIRSEIIINATSVGMKEGDPRLFNGKLLHADQIIFDIVYGRKTELLKDAISAGAVAIDGVMMLVYQGSKSLEIWTGLKAPVEVMEEAVRNELSSTMRNKYQ